jgi:hypothetical protein
MASKVAVGIERFSIRGSLPAKTARRAIERIAPAIRSCYMPAATRANTTPALVISVRLMFDENQMARDVQIDRAAGVLNGLAGCLSSAISSARPDTAPDVGTVAVTFAIRFTPEL